VNSESWRRKVKRLKGINPLHPPLLMSMLESWNLSEEQFHAHFVAAITIMLQTIGNKKYTGKRSWRQEVRQDSMKQHCRSRRICEQSQRSQGRSQRNPMGIQLSQGKVPSNSFEHETLSHIVRRMDIVKIIVGSCI
jgi:hypothetical protein